MYCFYIWIHSFFQYHLRRFCLHWLSLVHKKVIWGSARWFSGGKALVYAWRLFNLWNPAGSARKWTPACFPHVISCHRSIQHNTQHQPLAIIHARTHICTYSHTGFFKIIWYTHGGLFQSSPQNFVAHLECPSFSAINSWAFKCECLQVCLSTECMPRAQSPEKGHGYTGGCELPSTGAGNELRSSARPGCTPNCWAISLISPPFETILTSSLSFSLLSLSAGVTNLRHIQLFQLYSFLRKFYRGQ